MTHESREDRLRATHEQIYGTRPLDLDERTTLQEIRMDRAERKARERAVGTNRTEDEIQTRAGIRRGVKGAFLWILKAVGISLAGRAVKEVDKRL